jgi:hypothetical protein
MKFYKKIAQKPENEMLNSQKKTYRYITRYKQHEWSPNTNAYLTDVKALIHKDFNMNDAHPHA